MPQIINTNIASLNAQRNLDKSQSSNQQALQRLSSGLRINSAKDDAAGLAISTRFTSQIKGMNVAIRNAGDGIALAQTAEGALGSMNDSLQRIRELSVQSSNATNSDVDRDALQSEVDQLVAEISRTADDTDFNGRKLLDGSFSASFQVGANAGQTIDVSIGQLTADRLGSSSQSGLSAIGTDSALENGDLVINGVPISASKAEDDTASTSGNSASAISKVEAINRFSSETGVTAQINENTASGSEISGEVASGTFALNGVDIAFATTSDAAQTRASVTEAINAVADQTGITAVNSDSAAGGVDLVAADGRNIELSFDTSAVAGVTNAADFAAATGLAQVGDGTGTGAVSDTFEGGYTLIADGDQSSIDITGGNGTGRGDLTNAGLAEGSYDRAVAATVSEVKSDTTTASTNGGGTLSNTLAREDTGGTLLTAGSATPTGTAQVGTTGNVLVTGSSATFTVSDGTNVTSYAVAASGSLSSVGVALQAAAAADGITGLDVYEKINVTIDSASMVNGEGFTLAGQTFTISGTSADVQSEALLNAINGADFSAVVGATGYVHAELNTAGTEVSLTIKNDTASVVDIAATTTSGSIDVNLSGASVTVATSGNFLMGVLAFESTDNSEIEVVTIDTAGDVTGSAGTVSQSTASNSVLASSSETDISINIGGVNASPATPLAAGSTVAELANKVNQVEGVSAYEEIKLTITGSTLASGEQLLFTGSGAGEAVTATPDSDGAFTLAALVDDINGTDFGGESLAIKASLNAAGTSIDLTVRNFSANAVTLETENADGANITVTEGGGTVIGEQAQALSGELKFYSDNGQDVNVTLSDPTTGSELFACKMVIF
jgi:flagellin